MARSDNGHAGNRPVLPRGPVPVAREVSRLGRTASGGVELALQPSISTAYTSYRQSAIDPVGVRAHGSRLDRLAQVPLGLQSLAETAFQASYGISGAGAYRTPFGVKFDTPDPPPGGPNSPVPLFTQSSPNVHPSSIPRSEQYRFHPRSERELRHDDWSRGRT